MNVWIVEMWTGKRWAPTAGNGSTRKQAQAMLREWKLVNKWDKFRLRKYVREQGQ